MLGIVVAVGFVGMVLAPSAVALYSKLDTSEVKPLPDLAAEPTLPAPAPRSIDTTTNDVNTRRPVALSTSPIVQALRPVPSLREVAEQAARLAMDAQAEATKARIEALHQASRAASKRAEAAARLAEAAERELILASQASLQAEMAKQRAKAGQSSKAESDYLPADHPSLDFPRSRVLNRRVA